MAICIAKRKPRVEYSQVFNPWLSTIIRLLHRDPDIPQGGSLWSSSLKRASCVFASAQAVHAPLFGVYLENRLQTADSVLTSVHHAICER